MRRRFVILGGGTGGTLTANRLGSGRTGDAAEIVVIDRDDRARLPAGAALRTLSTSRSRRTSVRPRGRQLRGGGVDLRIDAEVDRVETAANTVHLADGACAQVRRARSWPAARALLFGGDRGTDRPRLGHQDLVLLLHSSRAPWPCGDALQRFDRGRARRQRRRHADQVPGRSARVLASSRTGTCASAVVRERRRDHLRDATRRRVHQARRRRAPRRDARPEGHRPRSRVRHGSGRRAMPECSPAGTSAS